MNNNIKPIIFDLDDVRRKAEKEYIEFNKKR